ncbi:MAG TPA: hypothetical protein VKG03_03295 [Solirubrobacterales bacterium]|nr:hypothetical protein [Solirubrobacterales bacterium]
MASVETTTIRVRRSTQKRLAREAELAGTSVTEVLEAAADLLYEQRVLEGAVRSWEKHGDAVRAEMKDWLEMPGPPLPDDDWSDLPVDED